MEWSEGGEKICGPQHAFKNTYGNYLQRETEKVVYKFALETNAHRKLRIKRSCRVTVK